MPATKSQKRREPHGKKPPQPTDAPSGTSHALRETIESIVIAFVLAFLFRTFEAEAFVIPTGSMSPSLQGRHKDVDCSECGYRFRVSASEEEGDIAQRQIGILNSPAASMRQKNEAMQGLKNLETVSGVCPMCRQIMPLRSDLPAGPAGLDLRDVEDQVSYPGDRILVNKYKYYYDQPQRWDVVVFKFPGNGEMNYIKRLVGLPSEKIQLYQGDVFTRPLDSAEPFQIQRKPADKVAAMLQPVHDTFYQSRLLHQAGWPFRWSAVDGDAWQMEVDDTGTAVRQSFSIDNPEEGSTAWLRYRHIVPTPEDWIVAREFGRSEPNSGISKEQWLGGAAAQLVLDFNAYNSGLIRRGGPKRGGLDRLGWRDPQQVGGMNWVSDLAVQCDVDVVENRGELLLDLVEGGKHLGCTIDLETGQATLSIDGLPDYRPQAATPVNQTGEYRLRFANVDDQLLLWIDDDLVEFDDSTYDVAKVYGDRRQIIPRTSEQDAGDLAPVGVGSRGAALVIDRLQVLRDIYYIAVSADDHSPHFIDYDPVDQATETPEGLRLPPLRNQRQLFLDATTWPRFLTRRSKEFVVEEDQFFVMGDNSPASLDCRLWKGQREHHKGKPGGAYLDRRLLTGKAICVFWPHSWGSIPGLSILPGFPNFGDMRIVR